MVFWVTFVYGFGFVASAILAGVLWDDGKEQLAARIGLMTPVWPVTLAYGLYVLVGFLWKHAELELRKDRTS
jgi:hypothetical protein